jgi:hypothetical protein
MPDFIGQINRKLQKAVALRKVLLAFLTPDSISGCVII